MEYTKGFHSCGEWFFEYEDGTMVACPHIKRIAPQGALENDYSFDEIWGCPDCVDYELSGDYTEDDEHLFYGQKRSIKL